MVIGVGFDCNPMVFTADETGLWTFLRFLGEKRSASSGAKSSSQFSETFGKFYGQSRNGSSNDDSSKARGVHDNCITCISPLKKAADASLFRFGTSGLDGKVAVWDLQNQEDLSEYL